MPKEKKRTGKYCVAAGCTSTNADNVSIHEFPKETKRDLRRKWIHFVKTKRQDFTQPTRYSVLCELHFASECYPAEYRIKQPLGIEVKKKRLLSDAVPTIHLTVPKPSTSTSTNTSLYQAMPCTMCPSGAENFVYKYINLPALGLSQFLAFLTLSSKEFWSVLIYIIYSDLD